MVGDQNSYGRISKVAAALLYAVYYLMLLAMLAASFLPEYRVWGFNHWAYYPTYVAIVLFCVGAALPPVLNKLPFMRKEKGFESNSSDSTFFVIAGIFLVVFIALFYLLRARTHFLGDGYLILSNLPDVNPWIKLRNLGEELIHKGVYSLLGGSGWSRALLSYQLVSYVSGLFLLLTVLFTSAKLFSRLSDRILFFLGLTSAGYMLLYFGYVENYSVFVASVMAYSLLGLLALKGRVRRWYALIPMHICFATHAFGMALVPSALFLMASGRPIEDKLSRLSTGMKAAAVSAVIVLSAAAFLYFYNSSYFFRFAVVPLSENRFAVEGYTLFSVKHLVDLVNLLILLFPGLLLVVLMAARDSVENTIGGPENKFLLILALSTLGVVFLFDPKLGMPRDWDLFSFCGVPLAVWGFYFLVRNIGTSRLFREAAMMTILLGLVVLIPRAAGRAEGDIELSHVKAYARLDVKKTKNLSWLIRQHYADKGDTTTAELLYQQWLSDFPDHEYNQRGVEARDKERYYEAIGYFRQSLKENPMNAQIYAALGTCYMSVGKYDSAQVMLNIADGMNPNSVPVLVELARLYRFQSEWEDSEKYFTRALDIFPGYLDAALGLLELYFVTDQVEKHNELLVEVAEHPDAPAAIHKRLGDHYFSYGKFEQAQRQYQLAIDKGMEPSTLNGVPQELLDITK